MAKRKKINELSIEIDLATYFLSNAYLKGQVLRLSSVVCVASWKSVNKKP